MYVLIIMVLLIFNNYRIPIQILPRSGQLRVRRHVDAVVDGRARDAAGTVDYGSID